MSPGIIEDRIGTLRIDTTLIQKPCTIDTELKRRQVTIIIQKMR
jgi:hypothetical protein